MNKTLVCLGGGIEAVPIIQRVHDFGFRAVIVDGNPNAPAANLGYFIDASCYSASEAIDVLRSSGMSFDGVMCAAVDAPVACAEIAAAFGLPGLSVEAARLSQNKLEQVFALWNVVPHPDKANVEIEPGRVHIPSWSGVIKPIDSRGGRGVIRLLSDVDPSWAYEQARSASPTGRVMVEQWLDGPQLSTESIVQDGRVLFTAGGLRNYERLEEFAPFVIEDGFDEPWLPAPGDNIIEKCGDVIVQACRALDWYQRGAGTVKGDLVIHDECVHVIELAARLSGGFFSTHGVPQTTGVDLVGAAIRAALGETLKPIEPMPLRFVSQRYVFPEPQDIGKTVVAIDNHRPESAIFHSWNIHEDAVVQPVTSHPARWGQCIAVGATSGEARRRAGQGVREMKAGG